MNRLACMTASFLALTGCTMSASDPTDPADETTTNGTSPPTTGATVTTSAIQHVFVIAMENHAASSIYGNVTSAPYINNTLLPMYGRATNFIDKLPSLPSEPHYVWMEAGTNAFADHTFTTDNNPSSTNSTASTAHLSTQIIAGGSTWLSYQEGINSTTGACPIGGSGNYVPKHDPFVFFRDVSGATPSKTNAFCAAHHKPLTALATDLTNNTVAAYNFITPNLCHDMHSNSCAGSADPIKQGDDWLSTNVPAIISYVNAHQGVLFIVWDEPASTGFIPLIVVGPNVKPNFASSVQYSHSSLVKSVERILALPFLSTVSGDNDFSDFFNAGFFP